MVMFNIKLDPNFMTWCAISLNNIINLKNLFRDVSKQLFYFDFLYKKWKNRKSEKKQRKNEKNQYFFSCIPKQISRIRDNIK